MTVSEAAAGPVGVFRPLVADVRTFTAACIYMRDYLTESKIIDH